MKEKNTLEKLSMEELYVLSMERDCKNCLTKRALVAQRIIWERAGQPFHSSDHFIRECTVVRKF